MWKKGQSGNPGGFPKGLKHFSIRRLYMAALNDATAAKAVRGLRTDLTGKKRLQALELAAKVNKEIGAGPDAGMVVQILIATNCEPEKLKGFAGQIPQGKEDHDDLRGGLRAHRNLGG